MRMSTRFVSETKLNINFGISCELYIARCGEDVNSDIKFSQCQLKGVLPAEM
jgi:hypothetical protein